MKSAALIYNPIAGRHPARREKEIQEIARVLRASSLDVRLMPTRRPGTATDLARTAVSQGHDLILVCGGDGTLNEVINGITPAKVALGILPGGTANIAAKELGLPHDPVRAARQLPTWSPRRMALGLVIWPGTPQSEAGRRYFLSVAGIGFDAYVVYRLSSAFKMSAGVAAFVVEAFRQAGRYSFPRFRCVVKEREFETHVTPGTLPAASLEGMREREVEGTFAVVQRTSRYAGWLHLAPSANLFQARLTLCLFRSSHRARYYVYAAAVLARQHLRLRDVELVEASRLACSAVSETRIYFEVDGELAGQLPATFEVVPDALTLLVPPKMPDN